MKEYNICLLGSGSVGKSALAIQFVDNRFVESYDPTVEDCYRKECSVGGLPVMLGIIDTAGTEQFTSMVEMYIRNCQGFVLVYDVTKKTSFDGLDAIKDMVWATKKVTNKKSAPPMIVVANKTDQKDNREVLVGQALQKTKGWGASFIETSAKDRVNIDELFDNILNQLAGTGKGGGCCLIL
eukprot:m.156643 g.156643  ORF g.156643 m.156643 type:complete len:182 (-) comp17944_c0_seq3:499-1044(-)